MWIGLQPIGLEALPFCFETLYYTRTKTPQILFYNMELHIQKETQKREWMKNDEILGNTTDLPKMEILSQRAVITMHKRESEVI